MKLGEKPPPKPQDETIPEERFADNFHGIDPKTGRPFSYGLPDGLWILSSIYGFLTLAAIAGVVFRTLSKSEGASPFAFAVPAIMLMATIGFLLSRSRLAFIFMAILSLGLAIGAAFQIAGMVHEHTLGVVGVVGASLPFVAQALATYYVWTLRRDRILA